MSVMDEHCPERAAKRIEDKEKARRNAWRLDPDTYEYQCNYEERMDSEEGWERCEVSGLYRRLLPEKWAAEKARIQKLEDAENRRLMPYYRDAVQALRSMLEYGGGEFGLCFDSARELQAKGKAVAALGALDGVVYLGGYGGSESRGDAEARSFNRAGKVQGG